MLAEVGKTVAAVIVTYSAHYASIKVYSGVCVPDGILGYIQGFLSAGSPLCSATLAYASNSQNSYATLITMAVSRIAIDMLTPF
uniref:Uncharacterized protein n=1 Tax=viral metagenome TaxID=1070528 RepID=A0A6C0HK60_9ZZZZ